jgi:hypothetical protein
MFDMIKYIDVDDMTEKERESIFLQVSAHRQLAAVDPEFAAELGAPEFENPTHTDQ